MSECPKCEERELATKILSTQQMEEDKLNRLELDKLNADRHVTRVITLQALCEELVTHAVKRQWDKAYEAWKKMEGEIRGHA